MCHAKIAWWKLYLMYFCWFWAVIRPGTKAASGVSTTDMAKRQQNELWKRQMLRNLHMYISRERLCVHNLPPKMSDKQLKKLFLKHSNKGAKVVEVILFFFSFLWYTVIFGILFSQLDF